MLTAHVRLLRADLWEVLWFDNEYIAESLKTAKQLVQKWILKIEENIVQSYSGLSHRSELEGATSREGKLFTKTRMKMLWC